MSSERSLRSRSGSDRGGFNLVGLLFLLLLLAAGGLFYALLSRTSGTSSHWFTQSQVAFNLADAALKETLYLLQEANSAGAGSAPALGPQLQAVFVLLSDPGRTGEELPLVDSSSAATTPPGVGAALDSLEDYGPTVTVVLRKLEEEALLPGALGGIPPDPRERRGAVQLVATATIVNRGGLEVARSIVLEKTYKLVNLLPPLVGRFSLFVRERGNAPLNEVQARADPGNGTVSMEAGSPLPLELRGGSGFELVPDGTRTLDQAAISPATTGPDLLDRQGWVYLGGADGGRWDLNLAHGWGEYGESPLVNGYRRQVLFGDDPGADAGFRGRILSGTQAGGGRCYLDMPAPQNGLHHFLHGHVTNFEIVGIESGLHRLVQTGGVRSALADMEPGESSLLRLFGSPAELSPTFVLGPVFQRHFRRASIRPRFQPPSRALCARGGLSLRMDIFRMPDMRARTRSVLQGAFQGRFDEYGTGVVEDAPFTSCLNQVLDGRVKGRYGATGVLFGTPDPGVGPAGWTSVLLSGGETLPAEDGLPAATLQRLQDGTVDVPELFSGDLPDGLESLRQVLQEKLVYATSVDVLTSRLVQGGTLRLPGIVLVTGGDVSLPAITTIEKGGILLVEGAVELTGDISRGGGDPLTIVALGGNLQIGDGAQSIEATLVSLSESVLFGGSDLNLRGSLVTRELDLTGLAARPARRVVEYDGSLDGWRPENRDPWYRIFYGDEGPQPKIAVVGGHGG